MLFHQPVMRRGKERLGQCLPNLLPVIDGVAPYAGFNFLQRGDLCKHMGRNGGGTVQMNVMKLASCMRLAAGLPDPPDVINCVISDLRTNSRRLNLAMNSMSRLISS